MSKGQLRAVIGAAVAVVAALAILTPTVIVTNGRSNDVSLVAPPGWTPYAPEPYTAPDKQRSLDELDKCLPEQGLGLRERAGRPHLRSLREALKACGLQMPGDRFRP